VCCEYSKSIYEGTREGAIITVTLFGIDEGSSLSREFASLLGITNTWDFNQHVIDPKKVDRTGLTEFCEIYTDYSCDCSCFLKLLDGGFTFHFRPCG